ncbi:MAG: diguanylate cyclase, partial [Hyphomicrobiaceae bacterium]
MLAINLHLMRIKQGAALGAGTLRILDEIDESLEQATKELSAFTYLLHPPDLQREGLSATLCRYAEGFGRRTGLKISVRLCRG